MKIIIVISAIFFCQLSAHADLGDYLKNRVAISTINGLWESDALMVIQIGTFRGAQSTQIDSIIKRKNGDLILIRDQLKKVSDTFSEWEISRKAIKLIKPLDEKALVTLTKAASIENFQSQVKEVNVNSISSVQRYIHIYSSQKKWIMYDLVTFPALDKNPKAYEEWEETFRAVFKSFSG